MNKRAILNRIDGKVSDAHDSMDTGLEFPDYREKVGMVKALNDLRDFVVEISDDDDDDSELEELPQ